MDEDDAWLGSITLSGIDNRVWVVALGDGYDTHSGAMQASVSIRKAKEYATEMLARDGIDVVFKKTESGEWEIHAKEGR